MTDKESSDNVYISTLLWPGEYDVSEKIKKKQRSVKTLHHNHKHGLGILPFTGIPVVAQS